MIRYHHSLQVKRLSPLEIYQRYVALKQHFFSEKYDFITSNGRSPASQSSFDRRNDKAFFHVMARTNFPLLYLLANFIQRDAWIGEMIKNPDSDKAYVEWRNRVQSFTYRFKQELKKLRPDLNDNFRVVDGQPPYFIRLYLMKEIGPETASLFIEYFRLKEYLDRSLADDHIWQGIRLPLIKHSRLFEYDKKAVKSLILTATK